MKALSRNVRRNRKAILDCAAEVFKDRGFDGMGVADLARNAGMTHGGIYAQFKNKDDLIHEATRHSIAEQRRNLDKCKEASDPIKALIQFYLSPGHRDRRASGCPIAANASEVARRPSELQTLFVDAIEDIIELVQSAAFDERENEADRAKAVTATAAMIGGLTLARIYAASDPEQSTRILEMIQGQLVEKLPARS